MQRKKEKGQANDITEIIFDEIHRVLSGLMEQKRDVDTDYVAQVVDSRLDVHRVSPETIRYASLQQIKQWVRSQCRHRFDPATVAEERVDSGTEDLFADLLQDYYPVKREILGDIKPIYVPRDSLEEEEVLVICDRMEKVANTLLEHSRALKAWFYSK